MTGQTVIDYFDRLLVAMELARPAIDRLDGIAGDGDCGSTMVLGVRSIVAALPRDTRVEPADVLRIAAERFCAVGGSSGPLWGTGLLRAARSLDGVPRVDLDGVANALHAANEGIGARGRSREGERTLLDVMAPAARVLSKAAAAGISSGEALSRALAAAVAGAERTRTLTPVHGRDRRAAERVLGHEDAGAAAALVAWQAAVEMTSG